MNASLQEARQTPNAIILDVRTRGEYAMGHIPGSVLIPLDELQSQAEKRLPKDSAIFAYCRSGARSGQAVALLKQIGYHHVSNMGGILQYKGELEKGDDGRK